MGRALWAEPGWSGAFAGLGAYRGQLVNGARTVRQVYAHIELPGQGVDQVHAQALGVLPLLAVGKAHAIITENETAARKFLSEIDSAAVYWNASTRFTDGGQFGFGAEIGISTDKLHARGPMGLTELTTSTYVVTGDGHIRG